MSRQPRNGIDSVVTLKNATEAINSSIIPKVVHICLPGRLLYRISKMSFTHHIIVRVPRIVLGAHSAAYTGVVLDFAPTAKPSANRARSRFHHELATAIQIPVTKEKKQDTEMDPRRPKYPLSGALVQQPMTAEQSYGPPLRRPCCHSLVMLNSSK